MDETERKMIQELQENLYVFKKNKSVLDKLETMSIMTLPKSQYKLELLELYVDAMKDIDDSIIKIYYDELITLQPQKQAYYIIASRRSDSFSQKCSYLERAISIFENDYFVYNQLAELLVDNYEELLLVDTAEFTLLKTEKCLCVLTIVKLRLALMIYY